MIPSNPRTYSGNCAGRTAASSMNATGFLAPTHPVSNDRPALRTDQTRSISRVFVKIFERNPSRRSEEHTSELQSQSNLVCRLLLEKKKLLQNQLAWML